ncbi:hypothetical protein PS718_00127 [Pseudomonas fluorescens]|uniref:CdiI immunity protein domain-containing protein n=1 Tax=Pseudomonas fluorescens TaxID=294 RepID=A0A5E6ZJ09_PSEFL|nr:hypothetical protein [Pseudomonas fluorescens]VVN66452.1 hypothetical protein PS718_00127 [Pseudomonas fluorescens]
MKNLYKIVDVKNLLFVFDIENTFDVERERIIVEKNVNDALQLTELFDILLKPEFYEYTDAEQKSLIDTVDHFLKEDDNFDRVFNRMTTYFDDEVTDRSSFMRVLLECLTKYRNEKDSD